MSDSSLKWIEIFIGGKRTSSNGLTRHYTEDELQQVVDTYNPNHFKAPLIVSYPAHNTAGYSDAELHKSQLAYGYPEQLKRVGNRLVAGFKKISSKVKEWINNGEILSFSSSFYLPESPYNPYPGKLSLRHVSGCGIDPPACKGLTTPELAEPIANFANYAEEQEGSVEFGLDLDDETLENVKLGQKVYQAVKAIDSSVSSFMDDSNVARTLQYVLQQLRDRMIEADGVEEAEKVYPSYMINDLANVSMPVSYATYQDLESLSRSLQSQIDHLTEMRSGDESYQYNEHQEGSEVPDDQEWQSKFDELQSNFNEMKSKQDALEVENRNQKTIIDGLTAENIRVNREREVDQVTSFVDGLVRDRKLHPNERDSEIRDILALPNKEVADYGEGIGELTPRQRYMDKKSAGRELWNDKRLPIYPGDAPNYSEASAIASFAVPEGFEVDHSDAAIYNKAVAYCETHKMNPHNTNDLLKAVEAVNRGK